MFGKCGLCKTNEALSLCTYKGNEGCGSFEGCGKGFCAGCGHLPAYSLMPQQDESYKDYVNQVSKDIQEQNWELLKEKHGLKPTLESYKMRYCENCE